MRLFITGGTGFIRSHVLLAALKCGHQVRALRRSEDSKPPIALPSDPEWISGNLVDLTSDQIIGNSMLFGRNLLRQPAFMELLQGRPEALRVLGEMTGSNEIMSSTLFLGT